MRLEEPNTEPITEPYTELLHIHTGMSVKRVRQAVSPGDVKHLKEACFSKTTTHAHRTVSSVCVCACVCEFCAGVLCLCVCVYVCVCVCVDGVLLQGKYRRRARRASRRGYRHRLELAYLPHLYVGE
jgi:hypothetical protein